MLLRVLCATVACCAGSGSAACLDVWRIWRSPKLCLGRMPGAERFVLWVDPPFTFKNFPVSQHLPSQATTYSCNAIANGLSGRGLNQQSANHAQAGAAPGRCGRRTDARRGDEASVHEPTDPRESPSLVALTHGGGVAGAVKWVASRDRATGSVHTAWLDGNGLPVLQEECVVGGRLDPA